MSKEVRQERSLRVQAMAYRFQQFANTGIMMVILWSTGFGTCYLLCYFFPILMYQVR